MLIGAVAAVLASALASTAQARTYVDLSFDFRASTGERIDVSGSDGQVTVTAANDSFGAAIGAEGVANRRHLLAGFGEYGTVDMRFEPRGKPRVLRPSGERCSGHSKYQRGRFTGTFAFTDAIGGVSAARTSAKGALYIDSIRCPSGTEPAGPQEVTTEVGLFASTRPTSLDRGTDFTARRLLDLDRSLFLTSQFEFQDPVLILRWGTAVSGRRRFDFNRDLTRASVHPPPPFVGAASYRKTAAGRTWAGDLALALPGTSIPLTGADFRANLRRVRLSNLVAVELEAPRRLAQLVRSSASESASQSISRQASGIWSRSVTMPKSIFPR